MLIYGNKKSPLKLVNFFVVVGRTGFEPATPWSQTKYSTGLNYLPSFKGCKYRSRNVKNKLSEKNSVLSQFRFHPTATC
jgi:hypothetical protein